MFDLFDAVKRHTKRIVAFALLGMAGTAFCVDRFVLGYSGPRAAAAAIEPGVEPAKPATTVPKTAEATPEETARKKIAMLTLRMPMLGRVPESDAMVIPAAWHVDKPKVEEKTATSVAKGKPEFPKFVLSSVIGRAGDSSAAAMVNGTMVRVGQEVEGYMVKAVKSSKTQEPSTVTLIGPAGEITIEAGRPSEEAGKGAKK